MSINDYNDGYANGNESGYEEGHIDGRKSGYEEGYKRGIEEAEEKAYDDGVMDWQGRVMFILTALKSNLHPNSNDAATIRHCIKHIVNAYNKRKP